MESLRSSTHYRQHNRVLFYVETADGVGHFRRASLLVEALQRQNIQVALATGLVDLARDFFPSLRVFSLPEFRSSERGVCNDWHTQRLSALRSAVRAWRPSILLIESWPFLNRHLDPHMLEFLREFRSNTRDGTPQIICSTRDIIGQALEPAQSYSQYAYELRVYDYVRELFDIVLVHGNQALFDFRENFDSVSCFGRPVIHTGYVAGEDVPAGRGAQTSGVVVSAGSGLDGVPLLQCALAARARTPEALQRVPWQIVAGPRYPSFESLVQLAHQHGRVAIAGSSGHGHSPDFILHRQCPNLPELIAHATVSVSMSGYNTLMEVLQARVPAVVVPRYISDGSHTVDEEQDIRARRLEALGLLTVLPWQHLNPTRLAAAMIGSRNLKHHAAHAMRFDGASRTAAILAAHCRSQDPALFLEGLRITTLCGRTAQRCSDHCPAFRQPTAFMADMDQGELYEVRQCSAVR